MLSFVIKSVNKELLVIGQRYLIWCHQYISLSCRLWVSVHSVMINMVNPNY